MLPFVLLLLSGCSGEERETKGGIVSLNPCADQLLVALAPPERIAALSHYSREPSATSIPIDVARRFPAVAGTAEEVIARAPDLVLATSFTPPATRTAFARAGLRTMYLDSPMTIAASKAQVAQVAEAVGAAAVGRALNARIDRAVAAEQSAGTAVPALLYIGGDMVNGGGTLLDEMMRRTGFRNMAADYGAAMTGNLPVEAILTRPPALILSPPSGGRTSAIRRRLLAATGARVREVAFPSHLINCGGPTIPAALERLAAIRRGVRR